MIARLFCRLVLAVGIALAIASPASADVPASRHRSFEAPSFDELPRLDPKATLGLNSADRAKPECVALCEFAATVDADPFGYGSTPRPFDGRPTPFGRQYQYAASNPTFFVDLDGHALTEAQKREFFAQMKGNLEGVNNLANQAAKPIVEREQGLFEFLLPGGFGRIAGQGNSETNTIRNYQGHMLDGRQSVGGLERTTDYATSLLLQPLAMMEDVGRAIASVPGRLSRASDSLQSVSSEDSFAGKAYQLTSALQDVANSAEIGVGSYLGVRAGAAVVTEANSAIASARGSIQRFTDGLPGRNLLNGELSIDPSYLGSLGGALQGLRIKAPNPGNGVGRWPTTEDFLKDVAGRAEAKVGGTGSVPGTLKHTYAEKLIYRFQRMFGPVGGGLSMEQSYVGGAWLGRSMNLPGSVRLDVVEGPVATPSAVYDFKFTINPNPTMSAARLAKIRAEAGLAPSVPIKPVHP